jgi:predicted NBD/HSP70 family sugar kinase
LGGTVLAHEAYDQLLPHPTEALRLVQASITRMLKTLTPEQRQRLMGVGLAQPDHLGSWLRELDLEADFRAWDEFDFGARLAQALGQPVYRENDGNAAAIAELFFGVGHEESDFLYVFLGAALGGGAVVGGESLRGCSGNAADLGLMPVRPSRLASATPAGHEWDLLLSRASLNALTRHLRHHGLAVRSHDALAQLVEAQRPEVQEWLDDCIDALVPSLRAALAVLDVPTVVIDCNIDHGLVDQLMRRVDAGLQAIAPEARPAPHVRRGSFGANAGAVGAASLPMFFSFSPRADVLRGQPVDASVPRATPARKWPGGPGA